MKAHISRESNVRVSTSLLEKNGNSIELVKAAVIDAAKEAQYMERAETFNWDTTPVVGSFAVDLPEKTPISAIYQHKVWWLRTMFTEKGEEIPERTQLILTHSDGRYRIFMSLTDEVVRSDMKGAEEGKVLVEISANSCRPDAKEHLVLCTGEGVDPYDLLTEMAEAVTGYNERSFMLRRNKQLPSVFEGFGWCTWNAFYHEVNEKDILIKLSEFKEKGVPLRYLLIDDGWSDANYETRRLRSFKADKVKFPDGLKGCVEKARKIYPDLKVGVWHALLGYWVGLEQGSEVFDAWKDQLIQRNGNFVLKPDQSVIEKFYQAWHSYLKDCGIEFVKIDGQGYASMYYKGIASYEGSSGAYLRAAENSAATYFDNNLINCMGMAPENLWLRNISALSRSSDDFMPDEPHWFREHALQNSFNSLLQGLFYIGDWDMFWSDHVEAKQNAMLRAISGGPVYVSDRLERTDADMIAPLTDDNGTILRMEKSGLPTLDCLMEDPLKRNGLLKVFNVAHSDGEEVYAVAAFNVSKSEQEMTDSLKTEQVDGLRGKTWVAYLHEKEAAQILDEKTPLTMTLGVNGAEFILLREKKEIATILGDPKRYLSPYCIRKETREGNCVMAEVNQAKTILLYAEKEPKINVDGNRKEALSAGKDLYLVTLPDNGTHEICIC